MSTTLSTGQPGSDLLYSGTVCRVAVAAPLHGLFDYLPPADAPVPLPGCRVRIPFGRQRQIGLVMAIADGSSYPAGKLRRIQRVLDEQPLFAANELELIHWAADYYRYPVGEVAAAAMPKRLREGDAATDSKSGWRLSALGHDAAGGLGKGAPKQRALLDLLAQHPEGVEASSLRRHDASLHQAALRLEKKGWLERFREEQQTMDFRDVRLAPGPVLTPHQDEALEAICAADGFAPFLLYGVTGSGKTEVYLNAIAAQLRKNRQSLVLVPEIALTPQLVARFEKRFDTRIAVLHSGLADGVRLAGWRAAREGRAAIVIGTRSAVFTPLARPGLIVVDEEHDSSFKQQEGFRYSGRDLAVYRARQSGIPVVLGSATPSLESLNNVAAERYTRLDLPHRPGSARPPRVRLIDLREDPSRDGLSTSLNLAINRHLDAGGQTMLFLNRRGFAPAWFCPGCGWLADCRRCDASLTFHQRDHRLRCHHCGSERAPPDSCPECQEALKPVGQGTERIEDVLRRQFPAARIDRLDRDTTRRRGALEAVIDRMRARETDILVGTQMLTKGHHFPDVSLVGIVNADQGLFSTDFRAPERLAQMIVQVCGRAGRADRDGEVLIQSSFPEHPLLQRLIHHGYEAFARDAAEERRTAHWPPYAYLALVRARADNPRAPHDFLVALGELARAAQFSPRVRTLGPAPSPMARRAGQYHAQLLLQSPQRSFLQKLLGHLLAGIDEKARHHRVRYSIDVDPIDLF